MKHNEDWWVITEGTDGENVDIESLTREIAAGVPRLVAERIIAAHNASLERVVAIAEPTYAADARIAADYNGQRVYTGTSTTDAQEAIDAARYDE
jgi:hypothetical protein